MQKRKIMYLDVARIIATIAVLIIHVSTMQPTLNSFGYETNEWATLIIMSNVCKWAAPVFCCISGALFLDPDRRVPTKKIYTKYIPRIAVGLIFWAAMQYITLIVLNGKEMTKAEFIKGVFSGYYHQWYLFMIIGFYILVPILRKITEDKNLTKYFIAVCLCMTFIRPFLQQHPKLDWTTAATGKMFMYLPGYLAYFLLGYYINKFDFSKLIKILVYIGGAASFYYTAAETVRVSRETGVYYQDLVQYNSLTIFIQVLFVFILIKDVCSKINFGKRSEKLISTISKDTFGIYQMHPIAIFVFYEFGKFSSASIPGIEIHPIIAAPIFLALTYVSCEIVSHILNKIPLVKNYLV